MADIGPHKRRWNIAGRANQYPSPVPVHFHAGVETKRAKTRLRLDTLTQTWEGGGRLIAYNTQNPWSALDQRTMAPRAYVGQRRGKAQWENKTCANSG